MPLCPCPRCCRATLAANEEEKPLLWFNGVDGRSGGYLMPPAPPRQLADLACGATVDRARVRELQAWVARGEGKARRGLKEGLDPGKLDEAGLGRRLPALGGRSAVARGARSPPRPPAGAGREAARALLPRVRGRRRLPRGREQGRRSSPATAPGPGPADPERVPYYLLLVGDPEAIPFSLPVPARRPVRRRPPLLRRPRGVPALRRERRRGRDRRHRAAPAGLLLRARQPGRPGDPLERRPPGRSRWRQGLQRDAARLGGRDGARRRGDPRPAAAACSTRRRRSSSPPATAWASPPAIPRSASGRAPWSARTGPARARGSQSIRPSTTSRPRTSATDARRARPVAFCFACFGAGTPRWDDFTRHEPRRAPGARARGLPRPPAAAAARPPAGAGRWRSSATSSGPGATRSCGRGAGPQLGAFESALRRLLAGQPVGWAMEYLQPAVRRARLRPGGGGGGPGVRQGAATSTLLADLWTATHDARNYTIVGDPAVRVACKPTGGAHEN